MRLTLLGYFDIGRSFGLGDDVFPVDRLAPESDIGSIGIQNPLGRGVELDLRSEAPELLDQWRQAAEIQVRRPEMETGWSDSLGIQRETFDQNLILLALNQPIDRATLSVFAIGVALVHLEFGNRIPLKMMPGLAKCFEFAAYTTTIASALLEAAQSLAAGSVGDRATRIEALTEREIPGSVRDASGYEERLLIPCFTTVVSAIDSEDEALMATILSETGMAANGGYEKILFEYHGWLHYTWPTLLLQPRTWSDPAQLPASQIARMLECARIAHAVAGVLEAYDRLFRCEVRHQVDGYVRGIGGGRSAQDLNRLRTLALAVLGLTDFSLVTQSDEDQAYFRRFSNNAHLHRRHESVLRACETLYNIQTAETTEQDARRQNTLNGIMFVLATLTLVSVTTDAYNFVRADAPIFGDLGTRLQVLVEFILAVCAVSVLTIIGTSPRRRGRLGKAKGNRPRRDQ